MSVLYAQSVESQALPDLPISFLDCLRLPAEDLFHRDILPRSIPSQSIASQSTVPQNFLSRNRACRSNDASLQPFLTAESEREAQRCLEALTQQAAPIIARIVRQIQHVAPNRAGGRYQRQEEQEADDIYQDAMTLVIARLRTLRNQGTQSPIARYGAYVAATASHVCHERLRHAHPNRQVCRDRLRYLLTSVPGLALWRDDWGRTVCGLSDWQGRPASRAALLRLHTLQENPRRLEIGSVSPLKARLYQAGTTKDEKKENEKKEKDKKEEKKEKIAKKTSSEKTPSEFDGESLWEGTLNGSGLTDLLAWLGGPVMPQHLTTALIGILGVREITTWTPTAASGNDADAENEDALANVADRRVNVAQEVEQNEFLCWLWREVTHLPPLQRAALLLNLRDGQGRGVLALLAHTHTASAMEIAKSLPLSAKSLADVWPALPLEDSRIAQILGVTRQQVINLRKVARARLSRRLRDLS